MSPLGRCVLAALAAASCGGSPAPVPSDLPAAQKPTPEKPTAPTAQRAPEPQSTTASAADEPESPGAPSAARELDPTDPQNGLCVPMCVQQGQARAVSIEVVERDCRKRCIDTPTPAPACQDAAIAARARVDAVPMRRRATKVWTELGRADLHCGYQDGLLRALRDVGTLEGAARAAALASALRADPFAEQLCPGGAVLTADQTGVDAVESCAIDDPPTAWHRDVDAQTYLVARAIELRWQALGLDGSAHGILLSTLRLSTALAHDASR